MQLLKVFGFGRTDLEKQVDSFQARGALYTINKDARSTIFSDCRIKFNRANKVYSIHLYNLGEDQSPNQYYFPVHDSMDLITFILEADKVKQVCFEWSVSKDDSTRIGCHMDTELKQPFKKILCQLINEVSGKKVYDPDVFCYELKEMPQTSKPQTGVRTVDMEDNLNKCLIDIANKEDTRNAYTGKLYFIKQEVRKYINRAVIFTIKNLPNFHYSFYVYDSNGYKIIETEITQWLSYEANFDRCYIRWLDVGEECKIVEVVFDKFDAILNVKMSIQYCLYEMNSKKKMQDIMEVEDRLFLEKMNEPVPINDKIVQMYDDPATIQIVPYKQKELNNVIESTYKGKEQYLDRRVLCQAKIADCNLVSLADQLEMLVIDEDGQLKRVETTKLIGPKKEEIVPERIVMYDGDAKAMISADDKSLYSMDMNEMRIIYKYKPSENGLSDIVPEKKLAELGNYNTFLGVNEKNIYLIDPRIAHTGIAYRKYYSTNPFFNQISTTINGAYAVGSTDGSLRLYQKEVGRNANNKYPGIGDPVRHLDTTKDGRWLLSTYDKYIILLPTFTEDDVDLYNKKTKISERPVPHKLQIKLEHLSLCKVKDWKLLPAKFDESKEKQYKFIVSGFDQFVVIWSLSRIMKGDLSYTFAKNNEVLNNAEFKFNDISKLIMTTAHKVKVQQNELSK